MNAVRSDIADVALAGRLFAPHYAEPQRAACVVSSVPMRAGAGEDARAVSELRLGDAFAVLDAAGGWSWGYSCDDHYVGYVPTAALGEARPATHVVRARAALVFAAADIKAPVIGTLPMGARIGGPQTADFVQAAGGWIHTRHLRWADPPERDQASVAEELLGTPYRWGGRSGFGIDCSGLVQLACDLTGVAAPRDSDQQREAVGAPLADETSLARNDIVFFPGHVGIMADGERLIHANAHWMAVTIEPLAAVVARGAAIVARRRVTP